jgi:uncharacterized protein
MILIDTNVLVALVDEGDRLHARARRDLRKLEGPFSTTEAVLSEACFLLTQGYSRQRVRGLIERLPVDVASLAHSDWSAVFDWLGKYAEHEPDLCDAILVVLGRRLQSRIWTYDREFRTLWRDPDGKPLRVLGSSERATRRRRSEPRA